MAKFESVDASTYKTSRLKQRLKTRFPQLAFRATKRKNKSEIVYSDCPKKADVVEHVAYGDTSQTSSTESDPNETGGSTSEPIYTGAPLKDLYNVAITLQMEFDKNKKLRQAIIHTLGQNFLIVCVNVHVIFDYNIPGGMRLGLLLPQICWIRVLRNGWKFFLTLWLGFSDEPVLASYLCVQEKEAINFFPFAKT